MSNTMCIPGGVCAPAYIWIIMIVFVVFQIQRMWKLQNKLSQMKMMSIAQEQAVKQAQQAQKQQASQVVHEHLQFPRVESDPLIPPGRVGEYGIGGLGVGGAAGGLGSFEKWGFLTNESDQNTRIPLYGRSVGADQYEYYVIANGNNKIMLPNRKEIYTDDEVSTIPTFSDADTWRAYIYRPFSFSY